MAYALRQWFTGCVSGSRNRDLACAALIGPRQLGTARATCDELLLFQTAYQTCGRGLTGMRTLVSDGTEACKCNGSAAIQGRDSLGIEPCIPTMPVAT